MKPYAEGTSVPVERSKAELDRLLSKHGATQRGMGSDDDAGMAFVVFRMASRHIRLNVPLPKKAEFQKHPDKRTYNRVRGRTPEQQHRAWEQACRERWRALVLLVKAKLESIAIGQSSVEREFLPDVLLPNGKSVYEQIKVDIERSYLDGKMPPLLGMASP